MKQYPWKFKLFWDHIEWGQSEDTLCSETYFYYIYWFSTLPKGYRDFGFDYVYYDGPHRALMLWFFAISWSTPWTKCEDEC